MSAEDAVPVGGSVAPGWEPVRAAFLANFEPRDADGLFQDVGAACCVYVDGRPVVDLWGGPAYGPDTLQLVASCTKGALAICVHRLVERGELDLDAPVSAYWPELRHEMPVRWLLSHQAGLPVVDGEVTLDEVVAWDPVVAKLAVTEPVWTPGTAHGYHAVTYGWLVGEVVARVSGRSPGRFLTDEVAGPLGLDLHLGLPATEHHRVSPMLLPRPRPDGQVDVLTARMLDPDDVAHRAFLVGSGLLGWFNEPRLWEAELPAANGMATAHALARMYAACLGEVDGVRLLAPDTLTTATAEQVRGDDVVTGYETAYALGFQRPFPLRPMSGGASFGHYGMGGSLGFADPERGFALGYTVNQMGPGAPADPRSGALVDAVLDCL